MLIFAAEGDISKHHFVQSDSQCPNISFFVINIGSETFLWHVYGCTHVIVLPFDQTASFTEAEICNFERAISSDKNVGGFDVAVDESCVMKVFVAL